jgi:hypothetical protein
MIWQEFRAHNIIFALRSIFTTFLAWLSIAKGHAPFWRHLTVISGSLSILLTQWLADQASRRFQPQEWESTTATMPYWDGCSVKSQKRFKEFYAYCQFMATIACLAVANPAYSFSVMLPIQLASFLMTLVRKGILSAKGYHMLYTASLLMPFGVGFKSVGLEFLPYLTGAGLLYQLRKRGIDKYALWVPLVVGRILLGDVVLNFQDW